MLRSFALVLFLKLKIQWHTQDLKVRRSYLLPVSGSDYSIELKDYITKTQRPNFKSFVGTRIPEVSEWSMDTAITKPEDLHGTWWRRYKQVYMSVHNKDDARR